MFIQVIRGQVSDPSEVYAALDRWMEEISPRANGWLGTTAGVTEDGRFVCLARFSSEGAARRNSDRTEQHQWWMETSKLFTGDVAFEDHTEAVPFLRGGSDEAGFVQVVQGKVTDPDRTRELMDRATPLIAKARPDIIGGVVAMRSDGRHTEAIYFTSETAAREGERKEETGELKQLMDEAKSLERDQTYFDLRQPRLYSPH